MKSKNIDKEIGEEFAKRGVRRIARSERPLAVRNLAGEVSLRECKSRITIYLDADIINFYKELAGNSDAGYQTLINQTLREIVDGERQTEKTLGIKHEILQDKIFLLELKEELAMTTNKFHGQSNLWEVMNEIVSKMKRELNVNLIEEPTGIEPQFKKHEETDFFYCFVRENDGLEIWKAGGSENRIIIELL